MSKGEIFVGENGIFNQSLQQGYNSSDAASKQGRNCKLSSGDLEKYNWAN